jgi:deoxyribodipyrimidine photo-lyase
MKGISIAVAFFMFSINVRSISMSAKKSIPLHIHWFRNDLRLHDNPALNRCIQESNRCPDKNDISGGIVPIYCFDPRFIGGNTITSFGSKKCDSKRASFILQSVQDLRKNLEKNGSGLVVAFGDTEDVMEQINNSINQELGKNDDAIISLKVTVQEEPASEEYAVDKAVKRAIKTNGASGTLETVWAATLYDIDDLPFNGGVMNIPDTFTPFRNKVEKNCNILPPLPTPKQSNLALPKNASLMQILNNGVSSTCSLSYMPTLEELGYTPEEIELATNPDPRGVMKFVGGETAGLNRVQEYIFDKDLLKIYFDTRNGMLGADYSTKFAPWLAQGCISPRFVAKECRRYEEETGISNKSTYWVVFELLWGCFFRMFAAKYGNAIFFLDGTLGKEAHGSHPNSRKWGLDKRYLQAWKDGMTGYPLVDANMRELKATGFMSNRGRQNVASFLALDMNTDWRYGADHFESHLIDFDVYANWGNWCSAAGMTGGRLNRFNIVKQSKDYDSEGEYVKHWCPELSSLPANLVHEPWKMTKEQQEEYGVRLGIDYPKPIVPNTAPNPYSRESGKNSNGKGKNSENKRDGKNPNRGRGQRQDMKSLETGSYRFS